MNALAFPGFVPNPEQAAEIRLRILSLGAGVQSTTLALMAAHGEIGPMPGLELGSPSLPALLQRACVRLPTVSLITALRSV